MSWRLKIRAFINDNFGFILGVLALVLVLSLTVTAMTYLFPGSQDVERTVATWDTTETVSHEAPVVGDSEVFAGTLENRTVYFTRVTPVLTGIQSFRYHGADRGSLDVDMDAKLLLRSTTESGEREIEYWRTTRKLNSTSSQNVSPGEPVHLGFEMNVSEIRNQADNIDSKLGTSGRTEAILNVTVRYSGSIEGQPVTETTTYSLPILLQGPTYLVLDDEPKTTSHSRTEIQRKPATYGPIRSIVSPICTMLSTVLIGVFLYFGGVTSLQRNRFEMTADERQYLEYLNHRSEFDEWISTIRLPENARERPVAEAATLEDLVDFAIDTDNGVIADPESHEFYVVQDGFLYTYRRPKAATNPSLLNHPEEVLWERDAETSTEGSLETED